MSAAAINAEAARASQLELKAAELLKAGRPHDVRRLLSPFVGPGARWTNGLWLLGRASLALGDRRRAEREFRAGLAVDGSNTRLLVALGDLLAASGQVAAAERCYRDALSLQPTLASAVVGLCNLLCAERRPAEAVDLTTPFMDHASPEHAVMAARATALKALGRTEDALAINAHAVRLYPASAVAHHNMAATLGDLARFPDSEASAFRAISAGGGAPQTWLVYGRSLLGQNRLDEAEVAMREAVRRQPDYLDAQQDLAQLVWMRTEDVGRATQSLDAAIKAMPERTGLVNAKAQVLLYAGDLEGAYGLLDRSLVHQPASAELRLAASHTASLLGRAAEALTHAEAAVTLVKGSPASLRTLCEACLAAGQPERASAAADQLLELNAFDQLALAYRATAFRMLSDPRYAELYDYEGLVWNGLLDTPKGWDTLDAYLADLGQALDGVHPFRTHPVGQSLRHGSQASHLFQSDDPVIRAFFQAVDGPIRRSIDRLGQGPDIVRKRNRGGYRFEGVWSVRLRPGGFHADHVHPAGWLSSACYVELPQTSDSRGGREGWIKFGEPGVRTSPALAAEHFIEPRPGMLALFPSYMWHGTVPFSGHGRRLTIAFDLVPAS